MKKLAKRLALHTETVRRLDPTQLDSVRGGLWASSQCATGIPGKCSAYCDSEARLTCSQSDWGSVCTKR